MPKTKNGEAGQAYPDKSRTRIDKTLKERVELLEADQTVTEMQLDGVVDQLRNIKRRFLKRIKTDTGSIKAVVVERTDDEREAGLEILEPISLESVGSE